jgi:isoquinoline 1-oxidoreductase beta subunit
MRHDSMTRRQFIGVTSTAGAGLVLGFWLPGRTAAEEDLNPTDFEPNAWLAIGTDGSVTITVAKSEMGQGVMTALPMIVAEELEADWSTVRAEQAIAHPRYGRMGTGGSTSVRTSWDHLRRAGATAREMLISAAAARWKVDRSSCRARTGAVHHEPSGRSASFGELSRDAATLPVPEEVPLKEPGSYTLLGTPVKRLDSPAKINGSAVFGLDVRLPGMLYACVERCPVFGGHARSYDESAALALPGVRSILRLDSGIAVLADSTWAALQGRDALRVTWDEGPNTALSSEGIRTMLQQKSSGNAAVAERTGDAAAALARSARRLAAVYEAPYLAHATMEPMNCTAHARDGSLEIWAPTQNPQGTRSQGARLAGIDEDRVTVHTTFLGGGFGRRFSTDFVTEAVQASMASHTPVKVTWTRQDDMRHDWYRPVSRHQLEGGVDGEGRLLALTHRIVAPSISGQSDPGRIKDGLDSSAVEGAVELPYTIPNLTVEYIMANTGVPIGAWRSVYPSQNVFAVESFLDELAALAQKDPVEFRLQMMDDHPRMKRVLELAAEKSGWGTPVRPGRFRGVAFSPPAFFHTPVAQVVEITVEGATIRVHRVVCAIDCGIVINPDTVAAQMESGIVYGLTAALMGEITVERGRVREGNFDDYPLLTLDQMPEVEVHIVKSSEPPSGTGEPGLPAIAPALANAVAAATGHRLRSMPLHLPS